MVPKHDRQLIIGLQRHDVAINETVANLAFKNELNYKSEVVWLDHGAMFPLSEPGGVERVGDARAGAFAVQSYGQVRAAIGRLTKESRLYLVGHGDDSNQYVGGWTAAELAELLLQVGLREAKTVSLVACEAAGNRAVLYNQDTALGTFASQLATKLALGGVTTKLYARCYRVGVHRYRRRVRDWENPNEIIPHHEEFGYAKRTRATAIDPFVHKRQESKIRFDIGDGKLAVSMVNYPHAHGLDPVGFER
jgi:hypothetical protein